MKKYLLLLLLLLSSCSPTRYLTVPESHTRDSLRSDLHFFVKNTYIHDSIYIRERGDTVYIDRWHTEVRDSIIESHDTVRITVRDSVPYPVEVPIEVEKPVPRLYKWSTMAFWILLLGIIFYIVIRLRLKR